MEELQHNNSIDDREKGVYHKVNNACRKRCIYTCVIVANHMFQFSPIKGWMTLALAVLFKYVINLLWMKSSYFIWILDLKYLDFFHDYMI